MKWTDLALLFSSTHRDLLGEEKIGLVDCGAREDVPEPWATYEAAYPDALRVLGFEADGEEAARLSNKFAPCRHYVGAAAWDSPGRRPLYITDPPQTSSMFPPNADLAHYFGPRPNGYVNVLNGRVLKRTVEVPTTTVDLALAEHSFDADFLKIDTQGAEYEILEGAHATLRNSVFAVVAETWTTQIYKGVKPTWEVMRLLAAAGYVFMTNEVAGLVRRSFPDAETFSFIQRAQLSAIELLFFREARSFIRQARTPAKVYKAVGIADVFGFADYGVELLREVVMRWPEEMANVQRCYKEISVRRSTPGLTISELYPRLHG